MRFLCTTLPGAAASLLLLGLAALEGVPADRLLHFAWTAGAGLLVFGALGVARGWRCPGTLFVLCLIPLAPATLWSALHTTLFALVFAVVMTVAHMQRADPLPPRRTPAPEDARTASA